MIRLGYILFGLLLLIGCKNDIPDFERTNFEINGQEFEILLTHKIFDNYFKEFSNYKDFSRASKKLIFNPIENEILENAEAPFMINSIKIPYELSENLKSQINALDSGDVVNIIKTSLNSIVKLLHGPDTKIIILPTSPLIQETLDKYHMPGYGVTIGSGKILIAINPTLPDWKEFLLYAIAHEYHHSTWCSRNWINSDFSLIEYLVFEGRADAFAVSLCDNNIEIPATRFITQNEESYVWDLIKSELDLKGSDRITKVMFGNNEIPYGSGYTIGYGIVKAFKENYPDYSDLQIIDMEPKKILELSGFKN
jgi:uncharacterized protein YjaZ